MSTPDLSTAAPASSSSQAAKPQRVLACILCQQRKVKCDRQFPCANCLRLHAQFPERELLHRLRHYEGLLRENNIKFELPHQDPPATEQGSPNADAGGRDGSPDNEVKSETVYRAKDLWHAMNQRSRDLDDDSSEADVHEAEFKTAWDEVSQGDDHLLFGSHKTTVDLSTLHPEQVQIFRLWQIYLDNVNPLLKVTHTPTLQGRIIDAASSVETIKPTLAALMFSIYCVSVMSLSEDECRTTFGTPRENLLMRYRFGCQQALSNCGFLHSSDRDCLTAFHLYLIAVRPDTNAQSLSSMLGVAIRIAQRMGLHSESTYTKWPALEAEMCRRLWWSLILFDIRICEMAAYKGAMLTPTWDCKTPLNISDFDLQPDMKDPPAVLGNSTDALFAVARSQMSDFIRHSAFHLDFINPAFKNIAKDVQGGPIPEGGELVLLEKMVEDKYLKFCNSENPLHFMTMWTMRGYLAKNRLTENYSRVSSLPVQQTDEHRDCAISLAMNMLDCDTKLMTSPLTKRYLWFTHFHFPFLAYMHLLQDLRRRPVGDHVKKSWKTMSDNYEARSMFLEGYDNPFFKIFTKIVLQAWESREALSRQSGKPLVPPRIVSDIIPKVAQWAQDATGIQPNDVSGMSIDDSSMSMPMDFVGRGLLDDVGGKGHVGCGTGDYPSVPGQAALNVDVNWFNWTEIDWNSMPGA